MNIVVAFAHCSTSTHATVMDDLGVQHGDEDHPLLSRASQLQHLNEEGEKHHSTQIGNVAIKPTCLV